MFPCDFIVYVWLMYPPSFFSYVYLIAMATSKKVLYFFLSEAASFVRWNILDVTLWCFTPQFARSLCFLQLLSLSCHAVSLLTVSSTGLSAFWTLYKPCAFVSCVVACVCLTGSAPQCTEARIFGDYIGAVHGFALLIWSGPHFFSVYAVMTKVVWARRSFGRCTLPGFKSDQCFTSYSSCPGLLESLEHAPSEV